MMCLQYQHLLLNQMMAGYLEKGLDNIKLYEWVLKDSENTTVGKYGEKYGHSCYKDMLSNV